jgi:tRNA (guanine-N7-)-methyltransferase
MNDLRPLTGRKWTYGRRRGRKLRALQSQLMTSLMPELRIELPIGRTLDPRAPFNGTKELIWLEIGFGGGEHLVHQAASHPEHGFIGVEIFENGAAKLLASIAKQGLGNVRILMGDALGLIAALPPASIDRVYILYPDPWPKQRHHKRRLVSNVTVTELARVMRDGAELRLATDHPSYLRWMLHAVTRSPDFEWLARRPADWRAPPSDWSTTRYQQKALAAGRKNFFLRLVRKPRPSCA